MTTTTDRPSTSDRGVARSIRVGGVLFRGDPMVVERHATPLRDLTGDSGDDPTATIMVTVTNEGLEYDTFDVDGVELGTDSITWDELSGRLRR